MAWPPGPGGVIDIFDESGNFVKTLVSGSALNQPWGIIMAPSNFGPLSNTMLDLLACGPAVLKTGVLQQWSRRQLAVGKVRLFQTTTVQNETWVLLNGEWKRKLVQELRPGAWLVDLKRVDPAKPYDPDAPPFDPHGLLENTGGN